MRELFRIQDLKKDGVLDEAELVKLNQKIAIMHYGKDADKGAVRKKFQDLFRSRLDAAGQPVPYEVFRRYMFGVLNQHDTDERAQQMILEQFIAEASLGREAFQFASFASSTDAQFASRVSFHEAVHRAAAGTGAPTWEPAESPADGSQGLSPAARRVADEGTSSPGRRDLAPVPHLEPWRCHGASGGKPSLGDGRSPPLFCIQERPGSIMGESPPPPWRERDWTGNPDPVACRDSCDSLIDGASTCASTPRSSLAPRGASSARSLSSCSSAGESGGASSRSLSSVSVAPPRHARPRPPPAAPAPW